MSRWFRSSLVPILTMVVASCSSTPNNGVTVVEPDVFDVSIPLRDMVKIPHDDDGVIKRAHEIDPPRPLPTLRNAQDRTGTRIHQEEQVVQSSFGPGQIPSPLNSFEGQGVGMSGFTMQAAPPDTDGDIGPNHYVQVVNL